MVRNPDRIDIVLEELGKIWRKVPDLRLGQLLWGLVGRDPFYVEDYDLLREGVKYGVEVDESKLPEYFIGRSPWKDLIDGLKGGVIGEHVS